MKRDKVVCVDIFDNVLGTKSKYDAHKKPILHRAFSVFLVNDKGEVLIQKRANHKYHSGGLWANACCSHPQLNEDVVKSAELRLLEELGFTTKLDKLFSFVYLNKFNDNLYEYEYDHVLLGQYNGEVVLNKDEVSEFKWISKQDLKDELLKYPQQFSSWFLICAPRVLEILK